jgi:hypothetical protein
MISHVFSAFVHFKVRQLGVLESEFSFRRMSSREWGWGVGILFSDNYMHPCTVGIQYNPHGNTALHPSEDLQAS